jgi:glutathione S-transferase
MRLYIRPVAPNALKVLIFMAERGIELDTVDVETLSPEEYGRPGSAIRFAGRAARP